MKNTRKASKIPAIGLALIAAITLTLALATCSDGGGSTHTHQYGAWTVTTPATCTAGGVETGTCPDDGVTTTRTTAIDPNGHAFTDPTITPATCEVDGTEEGTCTLCNQAVTKTLAALGHDWNDWTITTPATEDDDGEQTRTCKRAGCDETETKIIVASGHTHIWGEWSPTTAPTCTAAGEDTRICTLNDTHKETRTGAAALGHDYTWETTAPATCTAPGVKTGTCTRNSSHTTTQPIAALGHTPDTETGLCVRFSVCGTLTYNLGDTGPGGGKIFYRSEAGFTQYADAADTVGTTAHYLEAAPADMPSTLAWYSSGFTMYDDYIDCPDDYTFEEIGKGRKNTAFIFTADANAPAAKACVDYSSNGKTDWFLPSKDELDALFTNITSVGNMVGNTESDFYWSSTPYNNSDIHTHGLSDGERIHYYEAELSVRAVRAF
jgi:hypothetical protein